MVQPFNWREKLSVVKTETWHFYKRTINKTHLYRPVARLQTLDGKMSLSWKNIWKWKSYRHDRTARFNTWGGKTKSANTFNDMDICSKHLLQNKCKCRLFIYLGTIIFFPGISAKRIFTLKASNRVEIRRFDQQRSIVGKKNERFFNCHL